MTFTTSLVSSVGISGENTCLINPSQIYFSHSRICPYFSGRSCQSLRQTFEEICDGKVNIEDLPLIEILQLENGDFISLNNRRLWVLKECNKRGLLPYDLQGKRRIIGFDSQKSIKGTQNISVNKGEKEFENKNIDNEMKITLQVEPVIDISSVEQGRKIEGDSLQCNMNGIFSDLGSLTITSDKSNMITRSQHGDADKLLKDSLAKDICSDRERETEKKDGSVEEEYEVIIQRNQINTPVMENKDVNNDQKNNYKESIKEQRKQARKRSSKKGCDIEEEDSKLIENDTPRRGKNRGKDTNHIRKTINRKDKDKNKRQNQGEVVVSSRKDGTIREEERERQKGAEGKIVVRLGSLTRLSKKQQEKYNKGPWSLHARFDTSLIRSQEKDRKEKQKLENQEEKVLK